LLFDTWEPKTTCVNVCEEVLQKRMSFKRERSPLTDSQAVYYDRSANEISDEKPPKIVRNERQQCAEEVAFVTAADAYLSAADSLEREHYALAAQLLFSEQTRAELRAIMADIEKYDEETYDRDEPPKPVVCMPPRTFKRQVKFVPAKKQPQVHNKTMWIDSPKGLEYLARKKAAEESQCKK